MVFHIHCNSSPVVALTAASKGAQALVQTILSLDYAQKTLRTFWTLKPSRHFETFRDSPSRLMESAKEPPSQARVITGITGITGLLMSQAMKSNTLRWSHFCKFLFDHFDIDWFSCLPFKAKASMAAAEDVQNSWRLFRWYHLHIIYSSKSVNNNNDI